MRAPSAFLLLIFVVLAGCEDGRRVERRAAEDNRGKNNAAPKANKPSQKLTSLFQDEWQARLAANPMRATREGVHQYNDRLPDVDAEAQATRLERDRGYLERLRAIDRNALSADQRLNYDLFDFVVAHRIQRREHKAYRIPFTSDQGFHTQLPRMHEAMPFATAADYKDYLSRLGAVDRYFGQHIDNLRAGLEVGFTQPRAVMKAIVEAVDAQRVDNPESSAFFEPFENLPSTLSEAERDDLVSAGREAIADVVMPAYARLHRFLVEEYVPGARKSIGASALPDGDAYYAQRVGYYTTRDVTPDEVHAIGRRELKRIRKEMQAIIDRVGFHGGFDAFVDHLKTDATYYADSKRDLLEKAAYIAKRIDGELPRFFGKLPRQPYGIRPVPQAIAPHYTTGRYWPAPENGRRGGLYMVNTYRLERRPLYALPALTLHEAVPGHHLQVALSRELKDVPEFRRALYPHAFGEGWALYAEKLGTEMDGIYEDAYDEFGRLSYEMWRAVRLIVDTGIHAKGWSRERAVAMLADNTALSDHNIQTEVDRYISWPGQALAYKMGELKILELRARAEDALGERFDLRAFHDAVLAEGGLPLTILEDRIESWIDEHEK